MPDITRRETKTGESRWRVRYRISGRGSPQRVKTFATEDKAVRFAGLVCHTPGCWRIARHPVEGTTFVVCAKHHPDDKPGYTQLP